mgnify:CR=1 FL=1
MVCCAITVAGEWTTRVLRDPAGNEFCVIGPGSSFLAGCGDDAAAEGATGAAGSSAPACMGKAGALRGRHVVLVTGTSRHPVGAHRMRDRTCRPSLRMARPPTPLSIRVTLAFDGDPLALHWR